MWGIELWEQLVSAPESQRIQRVVAELLSAVPVVRLPLVKRIRSPGFRFLASCGVTWFLLGKRVADGARFVVVAEDVVKVVGCEPGESFGGSGGGEQDGVGWGDFEVVVVVDGEVFRVADLDDDLDVFHVVASGGGVVGL